MKKTLKNIKDLQAGKNINASTKFIIHVLFSEDYEYLPFSLTSENIWHILRLASSNRVLFQLCSALVKFDKIRQMSNIVSLCNRIIVEGNKKIGLIQNTLTRLSDSFNENHISYLVVKTVKYFPYILNDIDILVPENRFQESIKILSTLQSGKNSHKKLKDGCDHFESDSFYKADLHDRFTWLNSDKVFLDSDLAWNNIRHESIFGVTCPVPDKTTEWILNALNIMFERYHFDLNTFLFIVDSLKETERETIRQQAIKYSWIDSLKKLDNNLSFLNQALGIGEQILFDKASPGTSQNIQNIGFPFLYPYNHILCSYKEQFISRRVFDIKETIYNLSYARLKSLISSNEKVSMYGDWYHFSPNDRQSLFE
jgi:hypothetical protein